MLKKFVSKALLSVVMDKSARSKLEAARTARREAKEAAATEGRCDNEARKPRPTAIKRRQPKPVTPERQALIREALAIQRRKVHLLDELDPAQRQKLKVMALQAFAPHEFDGLAKTDRPGHGPTKRKAAAAKQGRGQ